MLSLGIHMWLIGAQDSLCVGHVQVYIVESGVFYEFDVKFKSSKKYKKKFRRKFRGVLVLYRNNIQYIVNKVRT
jgi:hypothetical protein